MILATPGEMTFSSRFPFKVMDKRSGRLLGKAGARSVHFTPGNIESSIVIESGDSPIAIEGKEYRGFFELHSKSGKLYAVNVVRLDEYLYSVVPGEICPGWPIEALKAQAVAARTYTLKHVLGVSGSDMYDVTASTSFQIYEGIQKENKTTSEAVRITSGQIMKYSREPIMAYYHSTCGGMTVDDGKVWKGKDLEYLAGRRCNYCKDSPKYKWERKVTLSEIKDAIRKKFPNMKISRISSIAFKKSDKRVATVTVAFPSGRVTMTGNDFRLLFRPEIIRSLNFSIKKTPGGLLLKGYGWGHGVGMCQWGARGMALKGLSYRQILHYYYRNVQISSSSNLPVASSR